MQTINAEMLVIGGGATGTGIARDLAMRGFSTVLVEKGDLTHGTTGRFHGLLHSGGRYVVKDSQAARECIEENRILRRIMPQCIEDTGGYFVVTPWDDKDYIDKFVNGCDQAGIPVEEISPHLMLEEEPYLNPAITHCFRVPDASVDSFLAAELNAESARHYGATIKNYHRIDRLLKNNNRIVGALCTDLDKNQQVTIESDIVINASGAWAGIIAAMAGIDVPIVGGKGTMIAANHRIVNTVINRCKMPADGDIIVPAHTVAVIGTTDVKIKDPDNYPIESWEVDLLLSEGEKLIPGFQEMRMLRAWAGVRPLFQDSDTEDSRYVTRSYVLLDHETRDGIEGFLSITSGKWTTYRLMAQETVDLVCSKLKVERECRTQVEELPDHKKREFHYLGERLAEIEENKLFGELICECELVTRQEVVRSITEGQAKTIDDIRRDLRLGMGPCQGGFCTYRAVGLLHQLRDAPVESSNVALRDFLQERWKGLAPILWGQQLRQEHLDELVYLSILNAENLPGPTTSPLGPTNYDKPMTSRTDSVKQKRQPSKKVSPTDSHDTSNKGQEFDKLIIGAGMAGLVAGWQSAIQGQKTLLISNGRGSIHIGTGCIDILGFIPGGDGKPVVALYEGISQIIAKFPRHPYSIMYLNTIESAIDSLKGLFTEAGYPLHGSLDRNWLLPTALGTLRPTCLVPDTMVAGIIDDDKSSRGHVIILGFEQYLDFYPALIAENLNAHGISAEGITLDVPSLSEKRFTSTNTLARLFESEEFRHEVVKAIKNRGKLSQKFGFPAVLGTNQAVHIKNELEALLDAQVFEIPTLPPSIPGSRLSNILESAITENGGTVHMGMQVDNMDTHDKKITVVWSEAASRILSHHSKSYVLATGGILGGGIYATRDGYARETTLNLPVMSAIGRENWFNRQFLSSTGHPIYLSGITVDDQLRPVNDSGEIIYTNLQVIGSTLAGFDEIKERSMEGIALTTGYHVGGNDS